MGTIRAFYFEVRLNFFLNITVIILFVVNVFRYLKILPYLSCLL